MTMQQPIHPLDERLAALAGGDPEVTSDAALRAHVDSCDRCADLVRELGSLRTALAELPDLVPSRPLQLLPPVAEPKVVARGSWLRRLAGPAMATGFVLVVVGAIGSSGFSLGMASSGAAPSQAEAAAEVPSPESGGSEFNGGDSGQPTVLDGAHGTTREAASQGSLPLGGSQRSLIESESELPAPPAVSNAGGKTSDGGADLFSSADPRLPWLIVLGLGVGLLFAGIYLRFAQQPRAG